MTEHDARTALVVGGSSGIGLATAVALAETGRRVVIAGRSADRLHRALAAAHDLDIHLESLVLDAEDETATIAAIDALCEEGPPRVLVNSVGQNLSRTLLGRRPADADSVHPLEDFTTQLLRNTVPAFLCTRELTRRLVAAELTGTVVNISSAVHGGSYGQTAYAAGKSALNSMTRTWALELARYGIRVIGVASGVVEGGALTAACAANERHRLFMEALREQIPLRRFAQESEVAKTVVFCIENAYLTGTTITVDGGGLPDHS